MKKRAKKQIEISMIMAFTAMLVLALVYLAGNFIGGQSAVSSVMPDPYPELYAMRRERTPLPSDSNIVYLTFDDGPSGNTERLLEILDKYNAKATFFVTAQALNDEYLSEMYCRIVEEGHTLGLHSYTHEFGEIYASPDRFLQDIDKLRQAIEDGCGYRPSILRFPGGSSTRYASRKTMESLIDEVVRRGYIWYDWDIPTGDDRVPPPAAETIAKRIIDGVLAMDRAAIVLCHDNSAPKTTPDGVEAALKELTAKGYEFKALPSPHYAAPSE